MADFPTISGGLTPQLPPILALALGTHCAMESLRVPDALAEIQHLRKKLGADVNISLLV